MLAFLTPVLAAEGQRNSGPYNVLILEGGEGLSRKLSPDFAPLAAGAPWSISGWINPRNAQRGGIDLLCVGSGENARALGLNDGNLSLRIGMRVLSSDAPVPPEKWTAIAATYDGRHLRLYVNGSEVLLAELEVPATGPRIDIAAAAGTPAMRHFGGQLASLKFDAQTLSPQQVRALAAARPDFDRMVFHEVGGHWPWQVKQWRGLQEPQDPWTLPQGKAGFDKPVAKPVVLQPELIPVATNAWNLGRWRLAEAPRVAADGERLSRPDYPDESWYPATVPGTVLTTLIDRGIYPDPDHGLNNMAIPERLARQDYWYRARFTLPADQDRKHFTLTFKGINYAAEVWINGTRAGDVRGAFIRGVFDVSRLLHAGQLNAVAVRISPPPHPGIPHEESITAGPGENGGWVALDGPTFAAAEGWDWIPGIRDRNAGIWQDAELRATGDVRLLDPQVTTSLPLPATDRADVSVHVPVLNSASHPVDVTLSASFEGVSVQKQVALNPGAGEVSFTPAEFPQLTLKNPRLWWPNGYGDPALYHLALTASVAGVPSDAQQLRFGVRHVTYEFSLFDSAGRLRRVEVDVARGSSRGERLIDNTHEKIKKSPMGWAASLTAAGEKSPAVRELPDPLEYPHLTLRVNGVRILARGGNWGMDDSRKRIQRERLAPYFELHMAANLNIVRNWMGTNTEDVFYDLCDEYGLMVLNDFWASTQDFQVEPQDPQLFLANAADTVQRYRNHPSIVLWFGRNEGVPQPILNEGLGDLVARYDGTRHFTGSSNMVNLQGSGPYDYRSPVGYFTSLASGFSVETGTPSLATLEAIEAMVPAADRWPLSDTIAYHDWHFGGNGDIRTFMETLSTRYGEGKDLADFERKAQLMNYETYRAMFEGLQAHMWTRNSGRLLWMTHPAWPSNHWQIYSHDYDTHAAYYGVKKATEPVHAQMNLPDYSLSVVNTTREARAGLKLSAEVRSLDNRLLTRREVAIDSPANDIANGGQLDLETLFRQSPVLIVRLELKDVTGRSISDNTYVQAREDAAMRALNGLDAQKLEMAATSGITGQDHFVKVRVANRGRVPVLSIKLTLVDQRGARILPAIYSDNYLTLLPGEAREVQVRYPGALKSGATINVRGWNAVNASTRVH
jgi:hypothetical protein